MTFSAVPSISSAGPRPLGISLGDPTGIGPEVVVRALAVRPGLRIRIFGDTGVVLRTARALDLPLRPDVVIDQVGSFDAQKMQPGSPTLESGRAQVAFLEAATHAAIAGEVRALVTAPIAKDWAARAGFAFPGHTEYLAEKSRSPAHAMMLAGPKLRVTLATTHLPLKDVPTHLPPEAIASAILLTVRALKQSFAIATPRVAVAGLNPHAGEGGRFGDEEERLVRPGIALGRSWVETERLPAEISGPHVPDVVFRQAAGGAFDAVVALYHDQGLIPVKLLHFDEAVNVTLGLPFVRTSPDHGTGFDIAGKNLARPDSFLAALDLADHLSRLAR